MGLALSHVNVIMDILEISAKYHLTVIHRVVVATIAYFSTLLENRYVSVHWAINQVFSFCQEAKYIILYM